MGTSTITTTIAGAMVGALRVLVLVLSLLALPWGLLIIFVGPHYSCYKTHCMWCSAEHVLIRIRRCITYVMLVLQVVVAHCHHHWRHYYCRCATSNLNKQYPTAHPKFFAPHLLLLIYHVTWPKVTWPGHVTRGFRSFLQKFPKGEDVSSKLRQTM